MITPSQRVRLLEIGADLLSLWDSGKLHYPEEEVRKVVNVLNEMVQKDNGSEAWWFINKYNTQNANKFMDDVINKV